MNPKLSEPPSLSVWQESKAPEATTSKDKLLELLAPDRSVLLKELGLTPREQAWYYPHGADHKSDNMLEELIVADFTGRPLAFDADSRTLRRLMPHSFESQLETMRQTRQFRRAINVQAPLNGLSPFEGRIIEIPPLLAPYGRFPEGQSVLLTLQIPEKELRSVVADSAHAPGRVGFALGYVEVMVNEKGMLEVLEFGSDYYRHLRSSELKERYRDWDKILLRALIHYAQCSEKHFREGPQARRQSGFRKERPDLDEIAIVIPSLRALARKYNREQTNETALHVEKVYRHDPNDAERYLPGLPREQAVRLYHTTPLACGFTAGSYPDELVSSGKGETLEQCLHRRVSLDARGDEYQELLNAFPPSKDARWRPWRKLYRTHFPSELFRNVHLGTPLSWPVSPLPLPGFESLERKLRDACELAPAGPLDLTKYAETSPGLLARVGSIIERSPQLAALDRLSPAYFAPISKGIGHGPTSAWWDIPAQLTDSLDIQVVHLKEQNRNPSIRLLVRAPDGSALNFGALHFKGGGVGTTEGVRPRESSGFRLPIYRNEPAMDPATGKKPLDYANHRYWGGQSIDGAYGEYATAAALVTFLDAVDPALVDSTSVPLKLLRYFALPAWSKEDGATRWFGIDDYTRRFLGESTPFCAGAFLSATRSDVRVSQVIQRIFCRTPESEIDLNVCQDEVLSSLRYVYWAHGENFRAPERQLSSYGFISTPTLLSYLADIGDLNQEAAQRIFRSYREAPLRAMGAVHGGGGHLGGTLFQGTGAPFGGPLTVRNRDICGSMHDFESGFHMPWMLLTSAAPRALRKERSVLGFMHACDHLFFAESDYWMKKILFGARGVTEARSRTEKVHWRSDVSYLAGDDPDLRPVLTALTVARRTEQRPEDLERARSYAKSFHGDDYFGYFERGRKTGEGLLENPL